ncbi:hypothetical protein BJ741DRAFT_580675 [Chytriomyces cf. hyalinus JEL632]|nr:hypothetical protein BJ741DRAFT_580675 [Chytriomyces cf. hyalinus JEL632]
MLAVVNPILFLAKFISGVLFEAQSAIILFYRICTVAAVAGLFLLDADSMKTRKLQISDTERKLFLDTVSCRLVFRLSGWPSLLPVLFDYNIASRETNQIMSVTAVAALFVLDVGLLFCFVNFLVTNPAPTNSMGQFNGNKEAERQWNRTDIIALYGAISCSLSFVGLVMKMELERKSRNNVDDQSGSQMEISRAKKGQFKEENSDAYDERGNNKNET